MREDVRLLVGDCREVLPTLDAESVHTVITSPPYYQLRSYLQDESPAKHKEIGSEETPEEYLQVMVDVFRHVRRVLRNDGQLWLNMGDSYASDWPCRRRNVVGSGSLKKGKRAERAPRLGFSLKPKDLMFMPARLAIALQDDGWWVRCPITICKNNPMPESVTDRPTSATEMLFMLTKQPSYFYDADAIREPREWGPNSHSNGTAAVPRVERPGGARPIMGMNAGGRQGHPAGRNRRNWWVLNSQPTPELHSATFSEKLVEPCLLAGTSEWGVCSSCKAPWRRVMVKTGADMAARYARGEPKRHGLNGAAASNASNVGGYSGETRTTGWQPTCKCNTDQVEPALCLDPFAGSGTVGRVATKLGRRSILIELSEEYCKIAERRNAQLGLML